jgi:ElaB/YqjD/DUF883 family membrane-anchored ribosome-binding protein
MADERNQSSRSAGTSEETRSPEQIQAEIETTREEMGDTVAAIAEKTDVKKQAKRKVAETKARAAATKDEFKDKASAKAEELSGEAREAAPESAQEGAQRATEAAQQAGRQATQAAQENPVAAAAAGAFAAGLLIGWIFGRR